MKVPKIKTARLPSFQAYRVFNTWLGDPSKLALLEAVLDVIKTDHLVDNTKDVGVYLLSGLLDLQVTRSKAW